MKMPLDQTASPRGDLPPTIIMDERERGEIREIFAQTECNLIVGTLQMGDFILSPRLAVERKRGDDFVASIFDHRLFLQLAQLRAVFDRPVLILESPKRLFERKFINDRAIYGALLYITYKMRIRVIPTADTAGTRDAVLALARAEQGECDPPELESISAQIERKRTLSRDDQLYFVEGLLDVGQKRAHQMLGVFGTPELVLHSLLDAQIHYSDKGIPKNFTGLLTSLKGIGPLLIHRNQALLRTSFNANKKSKKKIKDV